MDAANTTTALVGVLAVLVGVLIQAVITHIFQRREETMHMRAAMRLVSTDLHKARQLLRDVRETGQWSTERTPLPIEAYASHALVLAQHLSAPTWKYIEGAMLGVQRLELIRVETQEQGRELTQEDLDHVQRIGLFIDKGLDAFDPEQSAIDHSDGF